MKTIQSLSLNLKKYRPFYFFNTESRLKRLDKSTMIKINGVTHYLFDNRGLNSTKEVVSNSEVNFEDILSEDVLLEDVLLDSISEDILEKGDFIVA